MNSRTKPLLRKTPLSRGESTFVRSPWPRKPTADGPNVPGLAQRVAMALGVGIKSVRRESSLFRSEAHRRNVAALNCACCGRWNRSQAAHLNLLAAGKAKGLKASDALLIPLCADDPGMRGCHAKLDQGGEYDKATSAQLQIEWLQKTRLRLIGIGQWPAAAEADFERLAVPYMERAV